MASVVSGRHAEFPRVSDPRALRALAHPVRIALLEAIALHGSLTATEAAKIVGGSVPNVSYHLHALAKHGYVVDVDGDGTGRARPWRLGVVGLTGDQDDANPATAHATDALGEVTRERWFERIRRFRRHRDRYPADVRAASGEHQFVVFGTPDEMREVHGAINDIVLRYADRIADPEARPAGAVAFELLMFAQPMDIGLATDTERAGDPGRTAKGARGRA